MNKKYYLSIFVFVSCFFVNFAFAQSDQSAKEDFLRNLISYFINYNKASSTDIVTPYIKIISPNGGDNFDEGNTYTIEWQSSGVDKVMIQLDKKTTNASWHLTYDTPASAGKFNFKFSGVGTGNDYRISIWDSSNANIIDSSDSDFSITNSDLINGICGSAINVQWSSTPNANLCSTGTASAVKYEGDASYLASNWTWSCYGSNGGTTVGCGAEKKKTIVNGICGSAINVQWSSTPNANLCSTGTASAVKYEGDASDLASNWTWSCYGSNGGTTVGCGAEKTKTVINGVCGYNNEKSFVDTPSSVNACSLGIFDWGITFPKTPWWQWTWKCEGKNGGVDANCYAMQTRCGSADGKDLIDVPSDAVLCISGIASYPVLNNNKWTWTCKGNNNVSNDSVSCSANKVASASIKVISPNGGDNLIEGNTYTVEWKASGVDKVMIQLDKKTANTSWHLAYNTPASAGKFNFKVSGMGTGSDYKISIWDSTNSKIIDSSDSYFNIVPANSISGVCGSANGQLFTSKPVTNLCYSGSASAVSGYGPWTWTCSGYSGGAVVDCATKKSSFDIVWNVVPAAENNSWSSVTYGNGLFVAVSGFGTNRVMTSPDGTTWTSRTVTENSLWSSVTYGNGLFVAVASSGTNRVMTSPDGINWTIRPVTGNTEDDWNSVTYGNGLFVAVGTNRVMTSPNGINWTDISTVPAGAWTSVTYGNGLFVAIYFTGNYLMTSPDGINWTIRSIADDKNLWTSVTYGNGLFVAVARSGTNSVMTSPDGITWTPRSVSEDVWWTSVTYGNGLFVAVGEVGTNRVMTSPDGINWTIKSVPENNHWISIAYGNGLFVAVSIDGTNRVMVSKKFNNIIVSPKKTMPVLDKPLNKMTREELINFLISLLQAMTASTK